jgi:hypothetical protein
MVKKRVTFITKKKVKEPRIIKFNTKQGEVSFIAKATVTKPIKISFTINKRTTKSK